MEKQVAALTSASYDTVVMVNNDGLDIATARSNHQRCSILFDCSYYFDNELKKVQMVRMIITTERRTAVAAGPYSSLWIS